MNKAWIFLISAAIFETGWTYALKFLSFSTLKTAWATEENLGRASLPFIAYVAFGGANIYFLSEALKEIQTATAIAVWTAVSLVLIKICDVFYFKTPTNFQEVFFMSLIVIGTGAAVRYRSSLRHVRTVQFVSSATGMLLGVVLVTCAALDRRIVARLQDAPPRW